MVKNNRLERTQASKSEKACSQDLLHPRTKFLLTSEHWQEACGAVFLRDKSRAGAGTNSTDV